MVQKAFAAFVMSLGVALVPVSNQAFGGSTRALLPVAAWDHMADSTSSPFGDFGAGPFGVLYVDAYRPSFTCTYDIPWDWGTPMPSYSESSRAATRTGCTRAELRPAKRDGPRSWRKRSDHHDGSLLSGRRPSQMSLCICQL